MERTVEDLAKERGSLRRKLSASEDAIRERSKANATIKTFFRMVESEEPDQPAASSYDEEISPPPKETAYSPHGYPTSPVTGSYMSRIPRSSAALHDAIERGVFPGAVLLVRYQGEILCHEAVGVHGGPPDNQPVTIETVYDLASLTKPLATTTAVLSLIQAGTLHFEHTVEQWIGALRNSRFAASTIRQLLNHSAGFPAWKPYYTRLAPTAAQPKHETERLSRMETFLSYVADEPVDGTPGSTRIYSDLGFIVLGLIVERSACESLATYCRRAIYDPLQAIVCSYLTDDDASTSDGMAHPHVAPTEEDRWRGRIVQGEVHDENAYALGGSTGHAGLFGTAESVGRVTQEWLRGVHGRSTVISPELIRECVGRPEMPGRSSWALGWDTPSAPSSSGQYFSGRSFGHLGYTGTSIWIDPTRDLEVILLSNRVHPTRENTTIQQFRPYLHDVISEEVTGIH